MFATATRRRTEAAQHTAPASKSAAELPLRRRRWLKGAAFVLYIVCLGELASRGYFAWRCGASLIWPDRLHYRFYPELRDSGVDSTSIRRDDATFDVLLLGGSVVHHDFGDIAPRLRERLSQELRQPVRVFNVGMPGHTSRDSLLKYQRLAEQRFELVIVYHGINETRMNNCQPEVYRADYTHCDWYARLAALDRHGELPLLTLPYYLEYTGIGLAGKLGVVDYLPLKQPPPAWMEHGSNIRTPESFRANLTALRAAALERGDPLMMMTFAYHLPEGYSEQAFRDNRLDYTPPGLPVEIWGQPANVAATLEKHNQVVRDLAGDSSLFVDQGAEIEPAGRNFNDICHLTSAGCERFVENAIPIIVAWRRGSK